MFNVPDCPEMLELFEEDELPTQDAFGEDNEIDNPDDEEAVRLYEEDLVIEQEMEHLDQLAEAEVAAHGEDPYLDDEFEPEDFQF